MSILSECTDLLISALSSPDHEYVTDLSSFEAAISRLENEFVLDEQTKHEFCGSKIASIINKSRKKLNDSILQARCKRLLRAWNDFVNKFRDVPEPKSGAVKQVESTVANEKEVYSSPHNKSSASSPMYEVQSEQASGRLIKRLKLVKSDTPPAVSDKEEEPPQINSTPTPETAQTKRSALSPEIIEKLNSLPPVDEQFAINFRQQHALNEQKHAQMFRSLLNSSSDKDEAEEEPEDVIIPDGSKKTVDEPDSPRPEPVPDRLLNRLHTDMWPNVNGRYDSSGKWHFYDEGYIDQRAEGDSSAPIIVRPYTLID